MPSNIVIGRYASATNEVAPFSASRAVDGQYAPLRRWVGNVPCALSVALASATWINRWVVRNMSTINGWNNPGYSMKAYSFQVSQDGVNWATVDSVSGNSQATTDRTFTPVQCNFVRVIVNNGLNSNSQVASIVELEVYDVPPTSPYLSNLTISSGTLSPTFNKNIFNYSATVANEVSSIVVTPTAEEPSMYGANAKIMVGTTQITSGQTVTVPLNVGENTIDVIVTSAIGGVTQKYTMVVTRAEDLYLASLQIKAGRNIVQTTPSYSKNVNNYTGSCSAVPNLIFTITVDNPDNVNLTIKGLSAVNNTPLNIPVQSGQTNDIDIVVESKATGNKNTYMCSITVGS